MAKPRMPKHLVRKGIIFAAVNVVDRMRIEAQAKKEGLSLSSVVRRAVLRDLERLESQRAS